MKRTLLFILALCALALPMQGQRRTLGRATETALKRLDEAIAAKDAYAQRRQARTDSLRRRADEARGKAQCGLWLELARAYSHVQADSALFFVNLAEQAPETAADADLRANAIITKSNIYAIMGEYDEALGMLREAGAMPLDNATRLDYLRTCRTIYGWMEDYTSIDLIQKQLGALTQQYRDSIIQLQAPSAGRNIVVADRLLTEGEAQQALSLSQEDLQSLDDEGLKPYIYSNIAEAYRQLGNTDQRIYYLALTAACDMECGVREYTSLPQLAREMYRTGDFQRAYQYMLCTLEDAAVCQARLRSVEATAIFPIIDRAYKHQQDEQRRMARLFNYALAALALLLVAAIVYLRKIAKKLAASRRQIARANAQLATTNEQLEAANTLLAQRNEQMQSANQQLVETDRVKEEYITYYLRQCREYIDALDQQRRNLLKLAKARQTDELIKTLKSGAKVEEEQHNFYAQFDKAFLNIRPQFVQQFNELLRPECQIVPKGEYNLTPELRIFALIRLGVKETAQIAHFFNYSPATIYNYRCRIRHASLYDREEFTERLMKL